MGVGRKYKPALSSRLKYNHVWARFCHAEGISLAPKRGVGRKNVNLYTEGLFKFQARPTEIRIDAMNAAMDAVERRLREEVGMSRSLTFDEAVDRIIVKTGASSVNSRWNKYGQTKRDVLSCPEALALIREELHPEKLAEVGLFTMSLKDELRDLVDGEPKDARVFMPVDLTLLVATVMVHGDFNDRFVDAHFEGSLGGSFFHGNADRLARRLLKHPYFGKGDAHKYDTSQNSLLRECVYAVRERLIERHGLMETVRRCLCHPRLVLPNGQIWQVNGGNPSGSFNTLVDNSILTLLMLAYCVYRYKGYVDWELIEEIVTGDDYLYSTSDSEFTPRLVSEYAAELGLDFDAEDLTDFSKADFCQRRFVRDGRQWVVVPTDAAKFLGTMLYNRCQDVFDLAVLSQSVLIEQFYILESRRVLRKFQEFLRDEYLVDLEYLTDRQIDRLYKETEVYECKLNLVPTRFKRTPREDLSCVCTHTSANTDFSPGYGGFEEFITNEDLWNPNARARRAVQRLAFGTLATVAASAVATKARDLFSRPTHDPTDPRFLPGEAAMPRGRYPEDKLLDATLLVKGKPTGKGGAAGKAARQRLAQKGKAAAMPRNIAVRAPVAMGVTNRAGSSRMHAQGHDLIISRREYVKDINGSVAFDVSRIDIDSNAFPWAKNFSTLYESYVFERCKFQFIPTTSSSATGYVILSPDYDPSDVHTSAEGKAEVINKADAKSGQAWTPIECVLKKADLRKQKSLYTGPAPGHAIPADLRMHSAGRLWICTGGQADASVIGELWVEYTIRFMTPQLIKQKASSNATGDAARFAGTSNAAPFGTAAASGSIPATFAVTGTTTSSNTWTFTEPWSGYVYAKVSGVGIDLNVAGSGDESSIQFSQISTTDDILFAWIDCDQGETFNMTIGNQSISAGVAYFVRGLDVRS